MDIIRLDEFSEDADTDDEEAIDAVGEGVALLVQLVGEADDSLMDEDGDDLIDD